MINRINPRQFIAAHFKTFYDYRSGKMSRGEIWSQFLLAAIAALIHVFWFKINDDAIGVVVSAASIVAGLILNLMVLIYTLLTTKLNSYNTEIQRMTDPLLVQATSSNLSAFRAICEETLANAAFCVFTCVILVVSAIMILTDVAIIKVAGQFFTVFSGVILIITLLIVLKRCYALIDYSIGEQ